MLVAMQEHFGIADASDAEAEALMGKTEVSKLADAVDEAETRNAEKEAEARHGAA